METVFFQQLLNLPVKADWNIIARRLPGEKWAIAIMPLIAKVNDPAAKCLIPLTLRGTPERLDEIFMDTIVNPAIEGAESLTNIKEYMIELQKVNEKSKMTTDKKEKAPTEKKENPTKFQEKMKRVLELAEQQKYGEAIGQMPSVKDFPEQKEEIEAKIEELKRLDPRLSLF